jgi:hypothetical protein
MKAPIAFNPDSSAVVGPAIEKFSIDDTATIRGNLTYLAASLDKSRASLAVCVRYDGEPIAVPSDKWDYTSNTGIAIELGRGQTPFQQGSLYEFAYEAKNRAVYGSAAIRDIAFFLHSTQEDGVNTLNPLRGEAGVVQYSVCLAAVPDYA